MRLRYSMTSLLVIVAIVAIAVRFVPQLYREWYIARQPIAWQSLTPTAIDDARHQGNIVLVLFVADWDPSGLIMQKRAMESRTMRLAIHQYSVTPVLVDITRNNSALSRLSGINYASSPFTMVYPAATTEPPIIIQGSLVEAELLSLITDARERDARATTLAHTP